MRIGVDAHMVGGRETGNETYVKGLLDGLAEGPDDITAFHAGSAWRGPTPHLRFRRLLISSPYLRLPLELPIQALTNRLDLLHVTYAAPLWSPVPLVVTVHDICYTSHPAWFAPRDLRVLSNVVPRSLRQAAHVITVSDLVRAEIMQTYGVPPEKITAIPNGPGPGADPITDDAARGELTRLGLKTERPYLLTVGNLQPRKNLIRLIDAFSELTRGRGHDLDLMIVGPRHYQASEIVSAGGAIPDRIHFTGYVTDRQLAACYARCAVFVFPSLYEGFGIPVLEAMAHGVPVASSTGGALPEVCGGAAQMFDPTSVPAMVEAIEAVICDPALREKLSAAGRKRAAEFSWKKTAELTRRVYAQVC